MSKVNRDAIITSLCEHHPWIAERFDKVVDLFSECQTDSQILLTKDLLSRFLYVDEKLRNDLYSRMTDYIVSVYNETTAITSMSFGADLDSGSRILDDLKVPLYVRGLRDIKAVSRIDDLLPRKKRKTKFTECNKLIVVDEFCGSGQTIAGRIKLIHEKRPEIEQIHFCIMAGMQYSLEMLRKKFSDVYFFFATELQRGILENYMGDELTYMIQTMLIMESSLSEKVRNEYLKKYSMGYGNAQSLISFGEMRNIPNSVFPWFWWQLNAQGMRRNNLFTRYENGL